MLPCNEPLTKTHNKLSLSRSCCTFSLTDKDCGIFHTRSTHLCSVLMANCIFDSPVQLVDVSPKAGFVPLSGKTVPFSYHGVSV